MSTTHASTHAGPRGLRSRPSRNTRMALLLALAVGLTSFGCAFGEIRLGDPFDREETLDHSQHQYTTLVRFSEFQKARSFIVDDQRDAFMAQMETLEDARFTDFESEGIELDDAKGAATINVTYTIYTASLPYEVEVKEKQEWSRDGITNTWRVRSTFEGLQKLALN